MKAMYKDAKFSVLYNIGQLSHTHAGVKQDIHHRAGGYIERNLFKENRNYLNSLRLILFIFIKEKKAMKPNDMNTDNIIQQGLTVEYVDDFCYLRGKMISNGSETNLNSRLNKARLQST